MRNADIIKDIEEWLIALGKSAKLRKSLVPGLLKFKIAVSDYDEWDYPANWVSHAHALWAVRVRKALS